MITRAQIDERVREWGLREDIVEKDYVLGWLLWGIGTDPTLGKYWVFKGGTCLKKCYVETYRFSEDLDFTVLPNGPVEPGTVMPRLEAVLRRVGDESGIDFTPMPPRIRTRVGGRTTEGRVYYRGPRNTPSPGSAKVDLTRLEQVVRPSVLRNITHAHADELPEPARIRCYCYEELFAEKLRAMGERSRPRDLYDIVNLFRRHDFRAHPEVIRQVLVEKCSSKGVSLPTWESLQASPLRAELESEWANMLAHQLHVLPPFEDFWNELPRLFTWIQGEGTSEVPATITFEAGEDAEWRPPPTISMWGAGIPLESLRFAATNQLCVEVGYNSSTCLIEPYALRRTNEGKLVLHAIEVESRDHRLYRIDNIESVRVCTVSFKPAYATDSSRRGY